MAVATKPSQSSAISTNIVNTVQDREQPGHTLREEILGHTTKEGLRQVKEGHVNNFATAK